MANFNLVYYSENCMEHYKVKEEHKKLLSTWFLIIFFHVLLQVPHFLIIP